MKIGILALQGDFEAHAKIIKALARDFIYVRIVSDLKNCSSLIIPGGESTTLVYLMRETGLFDAIKHFAQVEKRPIFGTCAGAIVLAKKVTGVLQTSLGLIDITIERNAYGRQISSYIGHGINRLTNEPCEMVFIRAPRITALGSAVNVLAECDKIPVCVREGSIIVATFHPEISSDPTWHHYFLSLVLETL